MATPTIEPSVRMTTAPARIEPRVRDIRTILDRQHNGPSSLLAVMEEIQGAYRYLPRDALIMVSERLPVPLSRVYSVATFYKSFSLKPRG